MLTDAKNSYEVIKIIEIEVKSPSIPSIKLIALIIEIIIKIVIN